MSRYLAIAPTALLIAAGLTLSGPALAADLGGDCCADLEERVAELEATTVRKGNRKVSLSISGFIGQQVMFWNDGIRSDMYVGDGGNIFSRFRFTGSAKIAPQVTVGFTYEFGANSTSIGSMNQLNGGDKLGGTGVTTTACGGSAGNVVQASTIGCATLRDETVWIKHETFGRLKIGQGSTATDNLILIDVAGLGAASTPDLPLYAGGFFTINKSGNGTATDGVGVVGITLGQLMLGGRESYDTNRREHVLYETPTLFGFTASAAVAADNFWDVALRYAGDIGQLRIAAGIGYRVDTDFNATNQLFNQAGNLCTSACDAKESGLLGSASVMHIPTGLFLNGAYGDRKRETNDPNLLLGSNNNNRPHADFWYVSGGISKNFFGFGRTVAFGEFTQFNDSLRFLFSDVTGSTVKEWGLGINQHIDAAAMEVFITYKHIEADFTRNNGTLAAPVIGHVSYRDFDTVIAGTKINF